MSTTSVTSSLLSQLDPTSDSSGNFSKMKQAWQQLSQSLQSGDLDGAKTAFATITQLQQQVQSSKGTSSNQNSQLSADMKTLGQALQSGDLSSAQSAFAAVQKDMQAAHGHHHHHGSSASSASSSTTESEIEQLLSNTSTSSAQSSSTSALSTYA